MIFKLPLPQFVPPSIPAGNPHLFLDGGMGMVGGPPMPACGIPAPSFRW